MKKLLLAICVSMASASLFAQVDSTNMAVDSASAAPVDTTSQSMNPADSTAGGSTIDSTAVGSDTTAVNTGDDSSMGTSGEVEITDEDLRKYAIVMDSVEAMKKDLLSRLSSKIKSNPDMKVARYNELNKAMKDEAELEKVKATDKEITFMKELDSMKVEGATKISERVEVLATDFVGTEKYNKIRSTLEGDTNLRTRYDKVRKELDSEESDAASAKTSN